VELSAVEALIDSEAEAEGAAVNEEPRQGGQPRWPLKFTGLLPTVQPVAAESPAVEESIKEGEGEGRERASEINK
jgi:hypothetical protein